MYSRYNSVTMFNRAFVVIVVCIENDHPIIALPVKYTGCLFKSSSVIRRGKRGGGFPRGIIPPGGYACGHRPIIYKI